MKRIYYGMKSKRGISPVIATVLLIAMVVVIGLIVFLWFRGMTDAAVTKFGGTNIELVCDDVLFDTSYSSNTLYVSNTGNVPIYSMMVKIVGDGGHETTDISDLSGSWPNLGLNQGGSFAGEIIFSNANTIILIPVLIGSSEGGEKTSICEERHGYEIIL